MAIDFEKWSRYLKSSRFSKAVEFGNVGIVEYWDGDQVPELQNNRAPEDGGQKTESEPETRNLQPVAWYPKPIISIFHYSSIPEYYIAAKPIHL